MSTHIASPLQFRAATEADTPIIAALLTQLNQAEGNDMVMDADILHRGLFAPGRSVNLRALLVTHENKVIGAALYYVGYDILTAVNGYHLGDLVIDSAWRRRGIGGALFAELAAQNIREGGHWISLTALLNNPPALAFYRGLGMTRVAVDFFAMGKGGLDHLLASRKK